MKARLGHFEIPARDPERAAAFFRRVFDWHAEPVDWDGPTYLKLRTSAANGDPTVQGGIIAAEGTAFDRPLPVLHLENDTIEACLERIEAEGGSILEPPRAVGGFGRFARFRDPDGHSWGLWTSDRREA